MEENFPFAHWEELHHRPGEGGFPGAAGTCQAQGFSLFQYEIHVIEGGLFLLAQKAFMKPLEKMSDFQKAHGSSSLLTHFTK